MIQSLWKMVWRFLKKLERKPPCDPAIPLVGIYSEETKIERDTCIPLFIAALFTIARTWKQPRCPSTDEGIQKLWYIYTMEHYSAVRRNDITLRTKVRLVKALVCPDVFELWCWRRLLRVPWTAKRSNQSILKEISPGISLEGMMLKL